MRRGNNPVPSAYEEHEQNALEGAMVPYEGNLNESQKKFSTHED